jgi:signal transduction histidine kinase
MFPDRPVAYVSPARASREEGGMAPESTYLESLHAWCHANEFVPPADATTLGRVFLLQGLSPDQIVARHSEAVEKVIGRNDARGIVTAEQFLLEVLIAYASEARQHLELLAAITHELATPLTVIQGNVAVLRKYLQPRDLLPGEIALREADIEAALERMRALREQLMAATQEPKALELVPLLLDHQVERAARWAEPALLEQGLELHLELDCCGSMIAADEQALESILGNLLSNAVRYTPAGGTITCSTRSTEDALTLEVADTGIGMSDEVQARIFEPYYRSEEARELAEFGLGLGLSLTKGLVDAMGGAISVMSAIGSGSTFAVSFPRLPDDV